MKKIQIYFQKKNRKHLHKNITDFVLFDFVVDRYDQNDIVDHNDNNLEHKIYIQPFFLVLNYLKFHFILIIINKK